jgi:hypothetical protein
MKHNFFIGVCSNKQTIMSNANEKMISVKCPNPNCGKEKSIGVPDYLFEKKQVGLLKIQIHQGVVCEHEFIIFLDRKGSIKGFESIDMAINLSDITGRTIGQRLFLRDLLKIYGLFAVESMIHAIILSCPITLIRKSEEKNRSNDINKLFNEFLPDGFKNPMITNSIEESQLKKAKIDEYLVISPSGIVTQTPWQDIPFTYEANLIKKANEILDDESQAVIIEQDLEFIFKKGKFIADLLKQKNLIYEDELKDLIAKQFSDATVTDYDINFLKRVIKARFNSDIGKVKIRSFDKLKEGLW